MTARRTPSTAVYLEVGEKKVFACAVDWPGWCRAGKTEELALEALAAYAPRYAAVAKEAAVDLPSGVDGSFEVVERVPGSATTDFGAPGEIAKVDLVDLSTDDGQRWAALVEAAWHVFERITRESPAELRKGPRGGGRDRDKMIDHVLGAEVAYARRIGIRHRQPALDDPTAIAAVRADIVAALRAPGDAGETGWPLRYAARRIAWHVLDHGWEMQDRRVPAS